MENLEDNNFTRKFNLHPANHLPSSVQNTKYDVIVIGGGQAGRNCAARITATGATCIVVEHELYGGDCPFWACVPSKAILRPSEALEAARAVGGARETLTNGNHVNVAAVFARRDAIVNNWNDGPILDVSEKADVVVVRGRGELVGTKKVAVNPVGEEAKIFEARLAVVIATGSGDAMPEIPGLLDTDPWLPKHAVSSAAVPEHLIIIGAGVVGCEMATAYTSLGGKVTLISKSKGILPRCHPEAGQLVQKSLKNRGTNLYIGSVTKVEKLSPGNVNVSLSDGKVINGSKILIAIGRKGRTKGLGLNSVGIKEGRSIDVDESLCVQSVPGEWLYAIGDVNGRASTTHMSAYEGRIAADVIIARSKGHVAKDVAPWSDYAASADHDCVPQVIFTDPTIASVGLSAEAATKRGHKVREVNSGFQFPGAWLYGDDFSASAWASWVIDTERKVLLGATFVGRDVTDLLHASTVAIVGEVPLHRLKHAVPSFPTRSEIYTSLLLASGL